MFLVISPAHPDKEPTILETHHLSIDEKCHRLVLHGSGVLLCGAVSRQWQDHLSRLGIEVHAFLAGDVREVLEAYLHDGVAALERYAMPGCKGNRGSRQARRRGKCRRESGEHHHF